AVYRYDERGCGLSTGKFNTISYTINDITNDLKFVFNDLKQQKILNNKKIGLIGHSLGGMATIELLDNNIVPDFLIQWATPIQKGGEFLKYQLITGANKYEDELIFETTEEKINVIGKINKVIFENRDDENTILIKKIEILSKNIDYGKKNYKRFTYANFPSTKELIKKNLEPNYKNSLVKILYVIGENDQYVDASKETALLKSFANDNVGIKKFMNLNHYLKNGNENVENMYEIENEPVKEIINWIIKQ
ncbi:MAG TPA: alpha/beta hydrolase, partial [Flavobacterium sp.]|nr:alpha/beta hydrolase [Flavobacterium sp.]